MLPLPLSRPPMLLKDAALDFIVDRMVDVIRMGGPWSSCRAGRRLVFSTPAVDIGTVAGIGLIATDTTAAGATANQSLGPAHQSG